MTKHFFDFEKPISDLNTKIEELVATQSDAQLDISDEITALKNKVTELSKEIYSNLTPWQISNLARHPERPRTFDYINNIFTDFIQLHGDRHFADDKSIVGGLAKLGDQAVVVIGHQKGRNTKENIKRNFGMPLPEGYRKALRLMKLAEKFNLPVFTFIDTPGAYPGIGAEERNQSEAIGKNIYEMSILKVPVIATVIGEGGSGGALAIAVGDQVNMLENAIYSVISPEGCASILWKDASKASTAAEILGITAPRLKALGYVDAVIPEPLGGAHTNYSELMSKVKKSFKEQLKKLQTFSTEELVNRRLDRITKYGKFLEEQDLLTT